MAEEDERKLDEIQHQVLSTGNDKTVKELEEEKEKYENSVKELQELKKMYSKCREAKKVQAAAYKRELSEYKFEVCLIG